MKVRRFLSVTAVIAMALAPVEASAATSVSAARAAPPMHGSLYLADDESNHGGGSVAVILGVLLIVILGIGVTSHGANIRTSP